MAISDLMNDLEKAVDDAKSKQTNLAIAQASFDSARDNYSAAIARVEELKKKLTDAIGDIFPSGRVRQA